MTKDRPHRKSLSIDELPIELLELIISELENSVKTYIDNKEKEDEKEDENTKRT